MVHTLVFIGMGIVGRCVAEMLHKFGKYNVIIIAPDADLMNEPALHLLAKHMNVKIIPRRITKINVKHIIHKYVAGAKIVVDVSYNVCFKPLVDYCTHHNILYVNTSLESWPSNYLYMLDKKLYNRTLRCSHDEIRAMKFKTTCVISHGMNPGLITHFARVGLLKAAKWAYVRMKSGKSKELLKKAIANRHWAVMAMILKLRAAHCSEVDTQISSHHRKPDEFMNTWSCIGFYEEGVDPVQIGWGTHEDKLHLKHEWTSPNQISLYTRGVDMKHESYVPRYGKIKGYLVSHSENDTLSESLKYGNYQPSAYYVYQPCTAAVASINEVKHKKYHELDAIWPMRGDVISGYDAVGSLLIFDKYGPMKGKTLWSGTILSVKQTRKLGIKYSGPTAVQVAISILAVIDWMKKHPDMGLCFPEDLPSEHILKFCRRYLGDIVCKFVPYKNSGKFTPIPH